MDWQAVSINVLMGALAPSVVLWMTGKAMKHDFPFWELLFIAGCAACVKQVPDFGIWISLPVYYVLFSVMKGIGYRKSIWMTLLAFLSCTATGLLLMYAGSLFEANANSEKPAEPQPIEQEAPQPIQQAPQEPAPVKPIEKTSPKPAPIQLNAPDWLTEKYPVTGIAESGGRRCAIINGTIFSENDSLGPELILRTIAADHVMVQHGTETFKIGIQSIATPQ
jgi:hypothetical protein